ncbi:hypothetical protein EUGRSUZ_E03602 [Eucalyptus grandis]|uniref:Uncharacterized protein n=2 Tax=Eucalyptus grandis TaxID=71139 RepID=A0ACC3KZU0_EUCGR|nr:hypothetical protein EUGRSUZ_E03602 [Eucalyptus grandis]
MIQRLGIKPLFQEQIKAILRWQYTHFTSLNHGKDNVYEIALRFRLLRQEGYDVPAACVNAAKMVSLMYNYEDKHGLGLLQTI